MSEEALRERVYKLIDVAGFELQRATFFTMRNPDGLEVKIWSERSCKYEPKDIPAVIVCNPALTDHQRVTALVHELTHACLHPPGCDDFVQAEYEVEEPCSHEAARIICDDYGITDYREVWSKQGVTPEWFSCNNDEITEVMLERVGAALKTCTARPYWAEPVDRVRWRQAKDDAAVSLEDWHQEGLRPREPDLVRTLYYREH